MLKEGIEFILYTEMYTFFYLDLRLSYPAVQKKADLSELFCERMRSRSEEKSETWESSETVDRPSPLVATVPPWPGSLVFLKLIQHI